MTTASALSADQQAMSDQSVAIKDSKELGDIELKSAAPHCFPHNWEEMGRLRDAVQRKRESFPSVAALQSRSDLRHLVTHLVDEEGLPPSYVDWTMVLLASELYRPSVAAVHPEERLFLLPACADHGSLPPMEPGDDSSRRGSGCRFADLGHQAAQAGYQVITIDEAALAFERVEQGQARAIVGLASLELLEKAFKHVFPLRIPFMAIPIRTHHCGCVNGEATWLDELIQLPQSTTPQALPTFLPLLQRARQIFQVDELNRLLPPSKYGADKTASAPQELGQIPPLATTGAIARDFLTKGGKYSRPMVTLATYEALRDPAATGQSNALDNGPSKHSDAILKAALSIESFHKASLVHDDIEDDDAFRYGQPTLHRKYGIPTAINVGDYLIGLGYRLVSEETASLGSHVVSSLIDCLADAHLRLAQGQGAELAWRDGNNKHLSPADALQIYELKTSPAFEAAMMAGASLAGQAEEFADPIRRLTKSIGVAFQILNDLKDWREDGENKGFAGGDVLGGRPTLLWALALEKLSPTDRQTLLDAIDARQNPQDAVNTVRKLYLQADVFSRAESEVERFRTQAESVADLLRHDRFQQLARYLIGVILTPEMGSSPSS